MTTRLNRRLAALESQQRRPVEVDRWVVICDTGRHEYATEAEARAAHPDLHDGNTITIYERVSNPDGPAR